jgi:type II secretory pathway pseudopilin PulG
MNASRPSKPSCSAFTLVEVLVAMALIIFIMSILAAAFSESVAAFFRVSPASDLNAQLQQDAQALTGALAQTNEEATAFLEATAQTGLVDGNEASSLLERYGAISRAAADLEGRLSAVEQSTTDRAARLDLQRALAALDRIRISAELMVELLLDLT